MDNFKLTKPIRLIELFAGIGSQAMALKNIGADFENYKVVEFDKYAIKSYNAIHGTNFETMDITNIKGNDLEITDIDKYDYVMTYSFPCQDLSVAGKQQGMAKGSGTRSGLLWEVERLLNECEELPQVLLMENVPQVHGKKNIEHFNKWIEFLENKGYSNYWQDLNAKDFGIPQSRNRCFMISIRGGQKYSFPKPIELKLRLKDVLEDEVDEKYYLSKMIQKRLKITDETFTKNIIGNTKPDFRTIGERDNVYSTDGIIGTLTATDYKQPKQILEVIRLGGIFDNDKSKHQAGSIYNTEGLAPTLSTMQGGYRQPCIKTIKISEDEPQVKNPLKDKTEYGWHFEQQVYDDSGIIRTLKAGGGSGNIPKTNTHSLIVRKLTPKECWRLMGFADADFEKAEKVNSNSQLYKQAGNSIVVNVLEAIFKQMM